MPDDRTLLLDFLRHLEELLNVAFKRRDEIMPEHLRDPLQEAWPQFQERMKALQRQLEELSEEQRTALTDHGLSGAELGVKLAGFNANYRGFQTEYNAPQPKPSDKEP